MTPAARYAAAIDVLDQVLDGMPAEKALLAWSRGSRFAGSKDRAAVRDHVFDILRKRRSCERLGGALTGRGLVIGHLSQVGADLDDVFSGVGYAPSTLFKNERELIENAPELSDAERANLPDDLWSLWQESLGSVALALAKIACERGPISLRVNLRKGSREALIAALALDEIEAKAHPDCATAVLVSKNERRLKGSDAFRSGLFEFQDASSQIAMGQLEIEPNSSVLDFCAGGGGKSLALANLFDAKMTAHDIDPRRMVDIPSRAERAGTVIEVVNDLGDLEDRKFDYVLVDAPCSGSGTWRRTPDEKWRMSADRVKEYSQIQSEVLATSSAFLNEKGALIYATCSVFEQENEQVVRVFLQDNPEWALVAEGRVPLSVDQDGFYFAQLQVVC